MGHRVIEFFSEERFLKAERLLQERGIAPRWGVR
jgi:hypothetical protein